MLFLLSTIITTLSNFLLGFFVYRRNPKNEANITFFLLTISIAVWISTLYLYYVIPDPHWVLIIGRINYAAPTLAIFFLFHFTYIFPEKTYKFHSILEWFTRIFTVLLFLVTIATPYIDKQEIVHGAERTVVFGQLYPLWIIYFTVLAIVGLWLLVYKLRQASSTQKTQLKYLFAGLIITLVFGMTTNIFLPSFLSVTDFQPIGPVATLGLTVLTAYAIARHRFLDITGVVARTVSHTLFLLTVVIFEVIFVVALTKMLPHTFDRTLVAGFGAVIIVMGYDVVRKYVARLTDHIFFQGRYDTEDLLAVLTHIMASIIHIKKLSEKLLVTIIEEMKITQGAFMLVTDTHEVNHIESVNWINISKLKDPELERLLHHDRTSYVFDELPDNQMKEMFRKCGIAVALPLRIKNREIGLLLLGVKSSGEIYNERDLELLEIFAPQAAVALNNAREYQEIQEFTKTLEKKVEERTEELQVAQKKELAKAQEVVRIKDEFVFVATHDLATPVTAIAGFMDLIKSSSKKIPLEVKGYLSEIDEATGRLRDLVNDLLQVARGESGTIKVDLEPVDAVKTVNSAVKLLRQRASERKIRISVNMDTRHQSIMADQAKLSEVVENLISNGVKYNRDKGELTITSKAAGDRLVIEIADTGIGIPAEEQGKVFTKFYRSESDKAREQTGTGLGLFVVNMLVEKMKGKISFTSVEGKGTTFWLEFKLA